MHSFIKDLKRLTLPKLPFSKDALAPWMSKETLDFHHGKHHKAYVDKLNKLIEGTDYEKLNLDEIVKRSRGDIFNNAAQSWNHSFFWHCLTSDKTAPSSKLDAAIERSFGSFEEFQKLFKEKGTEHFGSGWIWVVQGPNENLHIETTPDAENPLGAGKHAILTCDLWEHAYYIDYRNERAKFLEGFFQLINWDFVTENFEELATDYGQKKTIKQSEAV